MLHLETSAVESWKRLDKFGEKAELPVVIWTDGPGYPAANLKYYAYDSDSKCALDNLHHLPQEQVQQSWWLTAQQQAFSCSVTWSITPLRWTSPGTTGKIHMNDCYCHYQWTHQLHAGDRRSWPQQRKRLQTEAHFLKICLYKLWAQTYDFALF